MGIKRLAESLNLSKSTVSRALNSNKDISPETRQRVLDAAADLGYSPNQSGRSLRRGRLSTVGLMLPAKAEKENYTWSLFLSLAEGIQTALTAHDLDLVIYQNSSYDDEFARLKRIVERRQADGIILAGTRKRDARLDYVAKRGFPFVAFGRSDSGGDHSWLDLDFEQGADLAVARLVAQGHRRIAIGVPDDDAMQGHVHLAGYAQALQRHGIAYDEKFVVRNELTERGGYGITESLLDSRTPPTAILFQSDCMAIGAYRKLSELGLQAGRDIAISGGVLTGEVSDFLFPRLTGYSVALHDLGVRLGEALLARMPTVGDHSSASLVQQLWPLTLQERNSDAMPV